MKLKNGLTEEQVKHAREILSQVNVSEICREMRFPRATVNHVLNGTSKKVCEVLRIIQKAKTKLRQAQNAFDDL